MYEIDSTFFIGQINVPNLDEPRAEEDLNFDHYIEKGCYLFLSNLLGQKLFNELKDNLDKDFNLKASADQKWKDLFYGKTYDDKFFKGLIQKHVTFKESVLAKYIFWYWLKDNLSQISGIGSVVVNAKNAENVSGDSRARDVWNSIVADVGERKTSFLEHKEVYRHRCTKFTDYSGSNTLSDGSLTITQFLLDNANDFPNPLLKSPLGYSYEVQNWLGL